MTTGYGAPAPGGHFWFVALSEIVRNTAPWGTLGGKIERLRTCLGRSSETTRLALKKIFPPFSLGK